MPSFEITNFKFYIAPFIPSKNVPYCQPAKWEKRTKCSQVRCCRKSFSFLVSRMSTTVFCFTERINKENRLYYRTAVLYCSLPITALNKFCEKLFLSTTLLIFRHKNFIRRINRFIITFSFIVLL